MKKLLLICSLVFSVIDTATFAQLNSIEFRRGVYGSVDELRDSSYSPFEMLNVKTSLDDEGISTFTFKNIELKADFDFENLYYLVQRDHVLNLRLDSVTISGHLNVAEYILDIQLRNSTITTLDLQTSTVQNISISNCTIDTLILDRSKIVNLIIQSGKIKYISFKECHQVSTLIIDSHVMLGSLAMPNFRSAEEGKVFIKIGCTPYSMENPNVDLWADSKTDFENIYLDYNYFKLKYMDDDNKASADETRSLFHRVLKKFEENGQSDNYLRLYKHQRHYDASLDSSKSFFLYIKSRIGFFISYTLPDWWWGFGFEKVKILWNTLKLFFICLFFGIFFYDKFEEAYPPLINGKKSDEKKNMNFWRKIIDPVKGILILFFGVEFQIDKLEMRFISIFILGIYLIGLGCLAFIANLIVS